MYANLLVAVRDYEVHALVVPPHGEFLRRFQELRCNAPSPVLLFHHQQAQPRPASDGECNDYVREFFAVGQFAIKKKC